MHRSRTIGLHLSATDTRLRQYGADQLVETCAISSDPFVRMLLLVGKSTTDLGEPSHDSLIDCHATANQRAHARRNLGIQIARIAARDLNTSELARTARGKMLAPDTGKLNRQC